MTRPVKIVLALVVVAAVAVGGFFVFEYFDHHETVKDAQRACGTLDTPKGSTAIPGSLGFTLPGFLHVNSVETQGKTVIINASGAGGRADLVKLRDAVLDDIVKQGFTKSGTDQEPTYEAEASFKGKISGAIRVRPLCTGRDEGRYTFRA